MTHRSLRLLAIVIPLLLVLVVAVVLWRDPYSVVRADFARQHIAAGLSRDSAVIDGHRWVYA